MRYEETMMDILEILVPILIVLSESDVRTAVAAASISFLADLETAKSRNRKVSGTLTRMKDFRLFEEETLRRYMTDIKTPYGGPISKYVRKSPSLERCLKRRLKEEEDGLEID
jgi:hypothetical protein